MKSLLHILILGLCFSTLAQNVFRPDSDTLKKVELALSGWTRAESRPVRLKKYPAATAWRMVFTREIAVRKDAKTNRRAKGMLLIYLLPQDDPGLRGKNAASLLEDLDWESNPNDLEQYEMYLGTGRGCHWYAKTDIGRLNFLKETLKLAGGEDMMRKMAEEIMARTKCKKLLLFSERLF